MFVYRIRTLTCMAQVRIMVREMQGGHLPLYFPLKPYGVAINWLYLHDIFQHYRITTLEEIEWKFSYTGCDIKYKVFCTSVNKYVRIQGIWCSDSPQPQLQHLNQHEGKGFPLNSKFAQKAVFKTRLRKRCTRQILGRCCLN